MIFRYYATGSFQNHIGSVYRVSAFRSSIIIQQVSTAILTELKNELMALTEENWIKVGNEFNHKWQMANAELFRIV